MTKRYLRVENEKNLVRDSATNAILNTDISVVNKHQHRMQQLQKETSRENEINSLKNDIEELRNIVTQLMSK